MAQSINQGNNDDYYGTNNNNNNSYINTNYKKGLKKNPFAALLNNNNNRVEIHNESDIDTGLELLKEKQKNIESKSRTIKSRVPYRINNYKVFVETHTHTAIEDLSNPEKPTYYYIKPFELNVDTLQYAVDKGHFKTYKNNKNGRTYVSLGDKFPSIVMETSNQYMDTRRGINSFYEAIEDETIEAFTEDENISHFNGSECLYKNKIKYKNLDETEYKEGISTENIQYVKNIAESLETDNYKCDLGGYIDENGQEKDIRKYIIRKDIEITDSDGQKVECVICGYPDIKSMRQQLFMLDKLEYIHNEHKTDYLNKFAELYNTYFSSNEINKPYENQIYKFMYKPYFHQYILNYLKSNPEVKNYSDIEKKYITMAQTTLNNLGQNYFNKPFTTIRYNFVIFKKRNGLLTPLIYNMRNIKHEYLDIFTEVNNIIKKELSMKFNILNDNQNEYKLFYSYVKYDGFFNINTEYLHTMGNFSDYAYVYKNSISLNEIIYMLSNNEINLSKLKINYLLKKYKVDREINNSSHHIRKNTNISSINNNLFTEVSKKPNITNLSKQYSKRITNKNYINSLLYSPENNKIGQIIILVQESYNLYLFVYKLKKENEDSLDEYRICKMKSNLANITNNIIAILNNQINNKRQNIYNCNDKYNNKIELIYENNKIFTILEDKPLSIDFRDPIGYHYLFKYYNPLLLKKIKRIPRDKNLILSYFFENDLFTDTENIKNSTDNPMIPNPYLSEKGPILYQNYINSEVYKKGLDFYKKSTNKTGVYANNLNNNKRINNRTKKKRFFKYKSLKSREKYINDDEKFKQFAVKLSNEIGEDVSINLIYYNPGNCGYNFIEVIDFSKNKKTVYIVPYDSNNRYLGNFMDIGTDQLNMLEQLNNIYGNKNNLCFFHTISVVPTFFCLHLHVLKNDNYVRLFPTNQRGIVFQIELYLENVIANLKMYGKYYIDYNINLLSV